MFRERISGRKLVGATTKEQQQKPIKCPDEYQREKKSKLSIIEISGPFLVTSNDHFPVEEILTALF